MNEKSKKIWILMFSAVFIFGFIVGSVVQENPRINNLITEQAKNAVAIRIDSRATHVFVSSFIINLTIFFSILIFSFWKVGVIPKLLIVLINGLGKGALISNIVCNSGVHGLAFSTMVFVPGMIVATCAMILFAAQSVSFKSVEKRSISLKQKLCALLIYLFFIFFSAGLDVSFAELHKALS